jgi:transposase
LLQTIPGVGFITTEVFLSEIADLRRFRSQKKVVAYAGLAPGQRESAGKRKDLGITHAGSGMLRWALNQASWQLVRRDLKWRRIFEDLAKRRGKKKAITAISRRLLCVMTAVVTSGRPYCLAA